MRHLDKSAAFVLVAGVAVLTASCGPSAQRLPETGATLEGTITYGGEKVRYAQVSVAGPNMMMFGTVGEDGRYKVENVPLGEVKVGVDTEAAKGEYISNTMASSYNKGPEAKSGSQASSKFIDIPKKSANLEASGMTTTINKGPNTYDIVILK